MDSLIHYADEDIAAAIAGLASRTKRSILLTFAPRTAMLALMHNVGRLFPRANRAPAIQPIAERHMVSFLAAEPRLAQWEVSPVKRVKNGFYISQALELSQR
jgi:magnesium-protoporphyrin O-methyltransferase